MLFLGGRAEEQSVLQGVRDGPGGSSSSPGLLSPLCQCTRGYSCVFLNFLSFFAFVILPFFIMKIILFSKIKGSSAQGCSPHSVNAPEDTVVFFSYSYFILVSFWPFKFCTFHHRNNNILVLIKSCSSSPGLLSPLCQCTRGFSCVFLHFYSVFCT